MFKLFKPKNLSIDLGTVNTLIYLNSKLVLNEPSVVAVRDDKRSSETKVIAVGRKAKNMLGRTPDSIHTIRPMKDGVIADFTITKKMLQHFIHQVLDAKIFSPSPNVLICVPCGATQVERRAIKESAVEAGARNVFLIEEPIAAALGAGMEIEQSSGHMVIDIGGGTTEVAIMSLNDIVYADSLRIAGDAFNNSIIKYVRHKHKVTIGETTAEKIKEEIGSAFEPNMATEKIYTGRDVASGLPVKFTMTSAQVLSALKEPLKAIISSIRGALEKTPPELSADIAKNGVMLTGGGALLEGLDKLIKDQTNLNEPLNCVARGGALALDLIDKHKMNFLSTE
ncbi:MAG: Rod shape-determining protein MreB [Candidatus Ruthia sp. Asou_11_S2]|nr:Rod shape-determining protein MreB [Candidatus Ruthia sp. Asou_11_S2]